MRVLVVDDHPLVYEVLAAVVRKEFPDATVLLARNLDEGFQQAQVGEALDLVLLDLGLPGCKGIDALALFREAFPRLRIVVVSSEEDGMVMLRALEAGAVGYIPKTHTPPLIAAALRVVVEGGIYVPPQVLKCPTAEEPVSDPWPTLTTRQLEVLRLIAKGLSNKDIGRRLRIAEVTVKHHASAAYVALGIESRMQVGDAVERRGIRLD